MLYITESVLTETDIRQHLRACGWDMSEDDTRLFIFYLKKQQQATVGVVGEQMVVFLYFEIMPYFILF